MAKARLDINIRPNTSDENKDILNKLRARGKVIIFQSQNK